MIKSVDIIAFGKLNDFHKTFDGGMNVIFAENGAGKTTLTAFIAAMFYGLPETRVRSVALNPRVKYAPWGRNEKFGGSLTFEKKGELYRVYREFGKTPKDDVCQLVRLDDNKQVRAENLGERLFGLGYNDFLNCFFVPQDSVRLDSTDNFSEKLSDMVGGAKCDKAILSLDEQIVELHNKRKTAGVYQGKLPEAMRERERLITDLKQAEERAKNIDADRITVKQDEAAVVDCKKAVDGYEKKLTALEKDKGDYDYSLKAADEKRAEKQRLIGQLPKCDFDAIPQKIENAKKLYGELKIKNNKHIPLFALGAAFILGAIVCAVLTKLVLCAVLLALGLGFCAWGGVTFSAERKRIRSLDEKIRAELFPIEVFDSYGQAISELNAVFEKYQQAQAINIGRVSDFDIRAYERLLTDKKATEYKQNALEKNISALNATIKLNAARLPDFGELNTRVAELDDKIEEMKTRFDALSLAKDAMQKAKENLSRAYLPKMAKELSAHISEFTDGKISSVGVGIFENKADKTTEFELTPVQDGKTYDIGYFSRGEREIALFCLRMALAKLTYGDEMPFALIDDAFVNYGEKEFGAVSRYLKILSEKTQIIYCTCHKRGEDVLNT